MNALRRLARGVAKARMSKAGMKMKDFKNNWRKFIKRK